MAKFSFIRLGKALLIASVVGATFYFGVHKQPTEMGIMAAMGLVLIAFANLDRFASFKGAGFEGVLKEAKEVTLEAKDTLEDLQALALINSTVMSKIIVRHSRLGGTFSHDERLTLRRDFHKSLLDMGIERSVAISATDELTIFDESDFENQFRKLYIGEYSESGYRAYVREWDEFYERLGGQDGNIKIEGMRKIAEDKSSSRPELGIFIKNMESYYAIRKIEFDK